MGRHCANRHPDAQWARQRTAPWTEGTAVKRTDLEKLQGKKVVGRMRREPLPDRYGTASAEPGDRREQRRRDAAAGLVPYAVKLPADIVQALQERAQKDGVGLSELSAELLRAALGPDRTR